MAKEFSPCLTSPHPALPQAPAGEIHQLCISSCFLWGVLWNGTSPCTSWEFWSQCDFYQTLSLLSLAVWDKESSVKNAESRCDWTSSVHAHGSHGGGEKKSRHKLHCSFLTLGLPRWIFWASGCTHPSFCECFSFPSVNAGSDEFSDGNIQNQPIYASTCSFSTPGSSMTDLL